MSMLWRHHKPVAAPQTVKPEPAPKEPPKQEPKSKKSSRE